MFDTDGIPEGFFLIGKGQKTCKITQHAKT